MSDSNLIELQLDLAARLQADEILGRLVVVTERTGNIVNEVDRALSMVTDRSGTRGLCLVVLQPVGNVEAPNLPAPHLELDLAIRVLETPVMNTTGMAALTAARRVARILHHYHPQGLANVLTAASPFLAPVADPIAPLAYDVRFRTSEAQIETGGKVETPQIAVHPTLTGHVVISCGAIGAAILVTVDGSHPWPGNTAAVPYSGPIAVQPGMTVRAAAFLSGHIASDVASATIDPA